MKKYLIILLAFAALTGCATSDEAGDDSGSEAPKSKKSVLSEESSATTAPVAPNAKTVSELSKAFDSRSPKELFNVAGSILARDPYNPQALNALAMHHMGKGEWGAARLLLEKALEKHKDNAGLHNNLGVIAFREDNLEVAYAHFKTAYSKDPKNPNVNNNLGSIYVKYLDYGRAERPIEDAYSYMSDSPSVTNNYAIIKRVQGRYDESAALYKKILDKDPRNVSTMLNYAILLIEYMKKYDEGVKLLNKLEFLESNEPYIRQKITELNVKATQAKK